ncbi:MAG TPA: type II toxin-antitoxin system HicB family antitoxin [Beijerinckiaceae bacterium]|jgi:predicted HicB family RNase H-like nuclease
MSTLAYKGHVARIAFDPEDMIFVGRLAGINDVVGFHARSVDELTAAFHDAVDDYIATCGRVGKAPEKPFSGKVMFRVDPAVHAKAALAAEISGKSLNQWAEEALREAAARDLQKAGAA